MFSWKRQGTWILRLPLHLCVVPHHPACKKGEQGQHLQFFDYSKKIYLHPSTWRDWSRDRNQIVSGLTGTMLHHIASFYRSWTTIENHRDKIVGEPKTIKNHRTWWLPPTNPFNGDGCFGNIEKCHGKINHVYQIWSITANFLTHEIQLISAMKEFFPPSSTVVSPHYIKW